MLSRDIARKPKNLSVIYYFFLLFFPLQLALSFESPYYPQEFVQTLNQKEDKDFKQIIFKVLTTSHLKKDGASDVLVKDCVSLSLELQKNCYRQKSLDYSTARKYLFGKLHLTNNDGNYSVSDVYCHKKITSGVGPMSIPSDQVLNCEHTWPQSKFNKAFSADLQKGDLHHLFPSDPKANAIRGNHFFGEVEGQVVTKCQASTIGDLSEDGKTYFEPPKEHKGNIARALFYFSVRYQLPISEIEENFLRTWDQEDPIDNEEIERNENIFAIQGNRNPFIDFPQLANKINNF